MQSYCRSDPGQRMSKGHHGVHRCGVAKRRKTSQVLQQPGVGALSTGTDKSVSQEILPDRPRYIEVEKP